MANEEWMKLPTLTVDQAAEILGVSRNHAYTAVKAGDIPSLRLGRRILVPTRPLLAMLGIDAAIAEIVAQEPTRTGRSSRQAR